jgi:hypothetical protein
MSFLLLLPAIVSLLLLGAHTMRLEMPVLMAIPVAVLLLLCWPHRWVARLAQGTLVLGALEWVRATLVYVSARQDLGMPWKRLAIILGSVALFTLLSSLVFRTRTLRCRYRPT